MHGSARTPEQSVCTETQITDTQKLVFVWHRYSVTPHYNSTRE